MPYIDICARWRPRIEEPDAIAERLARSFAGLANIDPLFRHWIRGNTRHRSSVPRVVSLPPKSDELYDWLTENPRFESQEGYKQLVGYWIAAETPRGQSPFANFWLSVRCSREVGWFDNRIGTTLLYQGDDLPNCITTVRYALVTLAMAWDCEWAAAAPADYSAVPPKTGTLPPRYASGWMVFLDKTRADRIRKAKDLIVESLPDGAILLTAVVAPFFDRHSAAHRAAARRLQAGLAPLNREAERRRGDS